MIQKEGLMMDIRRSRENYTNSENMTKHQTKMNLTQNDRKMLMIRRIQNHWKSLTIQAIEESNQILHIDRFQNQLEVLVDHQTKEWSLQNKS